MGRIYQNNKSKNSMAKKMRSRAPNHMWTKEQIHKVIKLWTSKTTQELADDFGIKKEAIQALATQIRKSGYKLPRKMVKGRMRKLIEEVVSEL